MKLLSKLLLGFIFAIALQGCVTQKRCLEKFPIVEHHDTLIVYRDTIIRVPIPGTDTVYKYGTIRDTVFASSGTAHAKTYVKHDTLRLFVWQSDTVIALKLDSAIQVISLKDAEIYTIQKECEKTKWDRYLNKGIVIVLSFVFIAIVILIKNLIK